MSADGAPQEITTLVGREVYSNNGVYVGAIEDIQLNLDEELVTALAVSDLNRELFEEVPRGTGVLVPYRWVRAVGDVVLINDTIERMGDPEEEETLA
jgi:sporulation protein YlmC with PRC-barrel domain